MQTRSSWRAVAVGMVGVLFATMTFAPRALFAQPSLVVLVRHGEKATEGGSDPSLSEAGKARAQATIRAASGSSQRWMTQVPVASRLAAVSFIVPSSRSAGAKPAMGGSVPSTLKKEKGAALVRPAASMVVTSAIGRGTTRPASSR